MPKKNNGNAFNALANAIYESRLMVLQNLPPRDIFESYCIATDKASKKLKAELKKPGMQWWIPDALNEQEESELDKYLESRGVCFLNATLFEKGDADRDLGPYIMAWRVERGDVLLTQNGLAQFGGKAPFVEGAQ